MNSLLIPLLLAFSCFIMIVASDSELQTEVLIDGSTLLNSGASNEIVKDAVISVPYRSEEMEMLQDIITLNKDRLSVIQECFATLNTVVRGSERTAPVPFIDFHEGNPFALLHNVIDDIDIAHINLMAQCIQDNIPFNKEDRLFNLPGEEGGYGGGNIVTYLTGFTQAILPDLTARLISAVYQTAVHTGWEALHPTSGLRLRTTEKIEYFENGELFRHADVASVYTLIVMLSPRNEYTGGEFFIENALKNNYKSVLNIDQYSAIIIDSMSEHGIQRVTDGHRVIFALEYWEHCAASAVDRRPVAGGYVCLPDDP